MNDIGVIEALRANVRLDGHEKECLQFRKEIRSRLNRIETILLSAVGSAILLLLNMVFKVV